MDIIQNYLETMFQAYPKTPEMERAKKELMAMMEDKYAELIKEGHNSNEAIGIVIAEFGNVEEILRDVTGTGADGEESENGEPCITYQQAVEYMQEMEKSSTKIGLGVWLCIASPSILLILLGLNESGALPFAAAIVPGISSLLILVSAAITLFIYAAARMQRYDSWKREVFWMDQATSAYVKSLRDAFGSTFAANLIVGIVICIISVIPIFVSAVMGGGKWELVLPGVGIALFLVGFGVYFLVGAGMKKSCYTVLLQEQDYSKERKERNKKGWKRYEDTYWIMVTVLYFLVSFWTRKWGITWIIWILAAGINNIMRGIMKKGR